MNILRTLTSNYIINVGFTAFFLAQIIKVILMFIVTRKIDLERLIGSGGMPSSHASLTSSVAVAMAQKTGFSSPEFGLALAFAAIVIYDAMGVRRAAGEQAKVLNKLVFTLPDFTFMPKHKKRGENPEKTEEEKSESAAIAIKELKELLGHTPMEVLGGCILGVLVAILMPMV